MCAWVGMALQPAGHFFRWDPRVRFPNLASSFCLILDTDREASRRCAYDILAARGLRRWYRPFRLSQLACLLAAVISFKKHEISFADCGPILVRGGCSGLPFGRRSSLRHVPGRASVLDLGRFHLPLTAFLAYLEHLARILHRVNGGIQHSTRLGKTASLFIVDAIKSCDCWPGRQPERMRTRYLVGRYKVIGVCRATRPVSSVSTARLMAFRASSEYAAHLHCDAAHVEVALSRVRLEIPQWLVWRRLVLRAPTKILTVFTGREEAKPCRSLVRCLRLRRLVGWLKYGSQRRDEDERDHLPRVAWTMDKCICFSDQKKPCQKLLCGFSRLRNTRALAKLACA